MIKKFLLKLREKIFREQNKKLNELQKKLDEQKKQNANLKNYITKEMRRRDLWKVKNAEVQRLAKGRPIWVIKSPVPDSKEQFVWGEYNFALSLKKELEMLGVYVLIQEYENWYCEIDADVVVVLRGPHVYHPDRRNEKCKYILWHLTHPETMEKEEYELYDVVCVNSLTYVEKMKNEVEVPVKPLLVCADLDKFSPMQSRDEFEYVFVGNTRRVKRDFVGWCEEHHIPLHIWGEPNGWKKYLQKDTCVKLEGIIQNDDLPDLYRKARIIMNDHFEDMRNNGFMNNRLLEVLGCGRPLISDYNECYEKVFGDSILFYRNEQEFLEKIKYLNENYEEQQAKVMELLPSLKEEFSFAKRAKDLMEMIEK